MNTESLHRSIMDRLMSAQVGGDGLQSDRDLAELKAAGTLAEEHGLLLIERLSYFLSDDSDETPSDARAALGATIGELAVLAHRGMEARGRAERLLEQNSTR